MSDSPFVATVSVGTHDRDRLGPSRGMGSRTEEITRARRFARLFGRRGLPQNDAGGVVAILPFHQV